MRLMQTNLILCSQDETAVSYSKLQLSLSNFEINYPFKNNLLLVHFELASKFFQQWKCSLKLKYAIANSYLFTVFRGSMPPFCLEFLKIKQVKGLLYRFENLFYLSCLK